MEIVVGVYRQSDSNNVRAKIYIILRLSWQTVGRSYFYHTCIDCQLDRAVSGTAASVYGGSNHPYSDAASAT